MEYKDFESIFLGVNDIPLNNDTIPAICKEMQYNDNVKKQLEELSEMGGMWNTERKSVFL